MKIPFKRNNGISKEELEALKKEGIIKERPPLNLGADTIVTLNIPRDQCTKIPGAKVVGQGEIELCLIPLREDDGKLEIVNIEITE